MQVLLAIAKCFLLAGGRLLIDTDQREVLASNGYVFVPSEKMIPPVYLKRSKVPLVAPGRLEVTLNEDKEENREMHRQPKNIMSYPT